MKRQSAMKTIYCNSNSYFSGNQYCGVVSDDSSGGCVLYR